MSRNEKSYVSVEEAEEYFKGKFGDDFKGKIKGNCNITFNINVSDTEAFTKNQEQVGLNIRKHLENSNRRN